ncbi:carbohydrate kinase, YjeF-related protein [Campylobacter subantarcticus LMG 24377]|uniref:Bifunctional NAD(P)H-hydrate repair enzyme n=1 Tax=Campylobacter subantarcticus TaxID=497724 RepID=A0ABW9N398_9BACT|nr:bifunctional ADP-dependent NAD(P)H-hydrate dehydratase/NAD(P)H-hydrate epimerase [Campylobacter subantarcticus]AJC93253.1 carbohydrate kinase, YjeF-related protein [Campylobacter subantarcticus LMG 24377]EAL3939601.1 bifunctional ADP-dependent NAD(P)H-hydrate dehydratase/NAD(P)H-hydrate epimerase [Campylobacter lari]MPB98557.1 bifunctional ADP-dependent NAD(P)H-hydrate dehydratase/NAD(P)H-hydrate epimerase [Campylobacter subantarcticus]
MKAICKDNISYEKQLIEKGLDEFLMMENAGVELANFIKKKSKKIHNAKILFLLGTGGNGADGLVAIRHLKKASAYVLAYKKSTIFLKQEQILQNIGFEFLQEEPCFEDFDIIVDCVFGSGLNKALDEKLQGIIQKISQSKAIKIACDIPSGLGQDVCFKADYTLCMGVVKEKLLEDFAKEFVGKIKIAHLGLKIQVQNTSGFLLERKDLKLIQKKCSFNKGDLGHVYIFANKSAGTLAGLGALEFGSGLVSLVAKESFSPLLMLKDTIESKINAAAIGMGLNDLSILKDERLQSIPLVLDANCFQNADLTLYLNRKDVVLTPHPKEFSMLLKLCMNKNIQVEEIQKKRFFYVKEFSKKFECVLVLKGANPIIAQKDKLFVVNCGNEALAKAGSGDVLSGMIAALLGAKFSALEAAKNAVLAHALVAKNYKKNKNSFDALKLVKGLKCL